MKAPKVAKSPKAYKSNKSEPAGATTSPTPVCTASFTFVPTSEEPITADEAEEELENLSNTISDSLFGVSTNDEPFTATTIDTTAGATFGGAKGDETFAVEVVSVVETVSTAAVTADVASDPDISGNAVITAFLEENTPSMVSFEGELSSDISTPVGVLVIGLKLSEGGSYEMDFLPDFQDPSVASDFLGLSFTLTSGLRRRHLQTAAF